MKPPRITEAARRKVLADVRTLLEEIPSLHDHDPYASAKFEGASIAILTRMAAVLETGNPEAHFYIDGPEWVRALDARYRDARRVVADVIDETNVELDRVAPTIIPCGMPGARAATHFFIRHDGTKARCNTCGKIVDTTEARV